MVEIKRELLWFVSGPLRPMLDDETTKNNALEIAKYVRVLERAGLCVTAPYLGIILGDILDDRSEKERRRGMEIDLQLLSRCDGNILVGHRFSDGMRGEAELACSLSKPVYNLTEQGLNEVYENAMLLKKYEWDAATIPGMFNQSLFVW